MTELGCVRGLLDTGGGVGAWWLGVRAPRAPIVFGAMEKQLVMNEAPSDACSNLQARVRISSAHPLTMGSHLTIQQMTHCFHSGGFSFLATREMVAMMKAQACGLESLELGNASAIGVLLLITVFMVRA